MGEEVWLRATDAETLLRAVASRASARKLRLFACQCARCLLPFSEYPDCHTAVEVAELMADEVATTVVIHEERAHTDYISHTTADAGSYIAAVAFAALLPDPKDAAIQAHDRLCAFESEFGSGKPEASVGWLRCAFGNPFRPVDFAPWRTDTAVVLARQMYESREFGAMPILADALQDAGCANEDVLAHCRGPGPHVRGCWVVDGVLGKE